MLLKVCALKIICIADGLSVYFRSARAQSPDSGSFFHRFAKSYLEDWNGTATSDPNDARRAPPSPVDSPPFPAPAAYYIDPNSIQADQ